MSELWRNTIITTDEHDAILADMSAVLDEYNYDYTRAALNYIIQIWADSKEELISKFKTHPKYLKGKFMIVFDRDYNREVDFLEADLFKTWLLSNAHASILGGSDRDLSNCLDRILSDKYLSVPTEMAEYFSQNYHNIHIHSGEKITRAVNKVCVYFGLDKIKKMETNSVTGRERDVGYNFRFARYADAMSPLSIKCHTVLSINPLDYLTMSFGNSWASCHTIDKENIRGMPNNYEGCYSSGTISYMLDETSMVLYTVDSDYMGDRYWAQPKINRQMFHFGNEKLIQGRLYPQSNDGCGDTYKPYREIVQRLIADMYGFPDRWKTYRDTDVIESYVISSGTHYRDYTHYSDCTISRIRNSENEDSLKIGCDPVCIHCGQSHDRQESIQCDDCSYKYYCEDCGVALREDQVAWVDGDAYCDDCATTCDCCLESVRVRDTTCARSRRGCTILVCQNCLEDSFVYCEGCNKYFPDDCVSYIESVNENVCPDCLEYGFTLCRDCLEYYPNDSITEDEIGECRCEQCEAERQEQIAELEAEGVPRIQFGR